jgi:hypothetical protein
MHSYVLRTVASPECDESSTLSVSQLKAAIFI